MDSIITHNENAISKLCKKYKVDYLYVFGSTVQNALSNDSDIDFLVYFSDSLSIQQYSDNYFSLLQGLKKVFNKEVDLITKNSLSNPYFIESVDDTKVLIYAKEDQKVSV